MTYAEVTLLGMVILILGITSIVWIHTLTVTVRQCPTCNDTKWIYKDTRNGKQRCAYCDVTV